MAADLPLRHPGIYLLGDHLDAALAMGEDLLTEKVALADPVRKLTIARLVRQDREAAEFLSSVRTLELSLISRLMQARRHCEEFKRRETRLRVPIALFVAGTTPLADAAAELGDTTVRDFRTGGTMHAFLRSRGLIAQDAAGFAGLTQLAVTEDYLVAGRIRLGTLLDLVAAFLDGLDLMFDLYGEAAQTEHTADGVPAEEMRGSPAESSRAT